MSKALEAILSPPEGSKPFTSRSFMSWPLKPFIRHRWAPSLPRQDPSRQGPRGLSFVTDGLQALPVKIPHVKALSHRHSFVTSALKALHVKIPHGKALGAFLSSGGSKPFAFGFLTSRPLRPYFAASSLKAGRALKTRHRTISAEVWFGKSLTCLGSSTSLGHEVVSSFVCLFEPT